MFKKTNLFLIDDDEDDVMLFREIVADIDSAVIVHSASHGKEALDFLQQNPMNLPDMIFLDLNMPKMSGKEFIDIVKQNNLLKNIKILVYTTSFAQKDVEETLQKGAEGYINKTANLSELRHIISIIYDNLDKDLKEALSQLSQTIETKIAW